MAEKRSKTDFDKTWQYQRILEILDCYWLSQPDEEYVEVKMYFRHKNGEEQTKHIVWRSEPDDFCSKDAVPVRHGKWTRHTLGSTGGYGTTVMHQCSECESMTISRFRYCPNCGARMDEE